MKASELKEWMQKNDKSAVDVASAVRVSERTIQRFLKGEHEPQPILKDALRRLVGPKTEVR